MKLLRIDSSPFGTMAISRRLTEEFLQGWLAENPDGTVITRDLTAMQIPIVTSAWVTANYTPKGSRTSEQNEILDLSAELIAELLKADEYVIGMPMHNWGPPSSFKLWIDQIITPSTLADRPLQLKRATFILATGRLYSPDSPDSHKNYLVPWLRTAFAGLGMRDMQFVLADGTKQVHSGTLDRESFLVPHREAIRNVLATQRSSSQTCSQTE